MGSNNCSVTASAALLVLYSPAYSVSVGGLGITQRTPFRIQVGLRRGARAGRRTRAVEVHPEARVRMSDGSESRETIDIRDGVIDFLNTYFEKELPSPVELVTSSNQLLFTGLHADSAWCCATAAALWAYTGGDVKALEDEANRPAPRGFAFRGTGPMAEVFRIAMKLEALQTGRVPEGHLIAGALLDSQFPIVFRQTEDRKVEERVLSNLLDPAEKKIEIPECQALRLADMFDADDLKNLLEHPFDAAVVFSGDKVMSPKQSVREMDLDAWSALRVADKLADIEGHQKPQGDADSRMKQVRTQLEHENHLASRALSFRVLRSLWELFTRGRSPEVTKALCRAQDFCHELLAIQNSSSPGVEETRSLLQQRAARAGLASFGSRVMHYGHGGSLLLVSEPLKLAEILADDGQHAPLEAARKPSRWLTKVGPAPERERARFRPLWLCDGRSDGWATEGVRVSRHRAPQVTVHAHILRNGRWHEDDLTKEQLQRLQPHLLMCPKRTKGLYVSGKILPYSRIHVRAGTARVRSWSLVAQVFRAMKRLKRNYILATEVDARGGGLKPYERELLSAHKILVSAHRREKGAQFFSTKVNGSGLEQKLIFEPARTLVVVLYNFQQD